MRIVAPLAENFRTPHYDQILPHPAFVSLPLHLRQRPKNAALQCRAGYGGGGVRKHP